MLSVYSSERKISIPATATRTQTTRVKREALPLDYPIHFDRVVHKKAEKN